jgi:hypothetical protein
MLSDMVDHGGVAEWLILWMFFYLYKLYNNVEDNRKDGETERIGSRRGRDIWGG